MEHNHSHTPEPYFPVESDIRMLLHDLQSKDGVVRKHARETLGRLGRQVVPALVQLLSQRNDQMRWEACKTLERVGDPNAGVALAEALMDESMDVRWVAGEALISLEECALEPLLLVLQRHFDSVLLRDAAHHVFYELRRKYIFGDEIESVFDALRGTMPTFRVGINAMLALNHLRKQNSIVLRKKELHH
jgi:HEAT repeat protein